ncbi:SUN domain-containing protein 1 [Phycodurus eques]|uniref:SUN domain-containing protein 1 n=1 Tax=Phycodurus eques TaxID=693459 RepID=UPI002ACD4F8E|nr:SUN domain-containing protein 1 [Phycodurus eques]XP_061535871.1 SUN domain-containing protein 1 [Phycodurus eques]XP_061535872.1 SUN domain-containing protein 1 [Phycodurus eques]XP_061535873.1 SUN domain-containing protein 1 [Phycodurus eques]
MSRRSCRLASTGYYNSDDESDSSSVTNISYRENPVKVFKKKAGTRKAASRASTRANSNASTSNLQSPSTTARRPSLSTQTNLTMGSVSYATPRATPRATLRPSLTPASSTTHQTATRSPAPPPERFHSSGQAVVYLRPDHKDQDKNCIDSSGYFSSEGINFKPPTPTTTTRSGSSNTTSKVKSNNVAPSVVEHRRQINSAFCGVKDSLSRLTAKIKHLITFANRSLISAQTKTTCIVLILLSVVAAFVWFLPPLLPLTLMDFIKAHSQIAKLKHQSILPAIVPPPPSTMQSTFATDLGTVPTDIEAKMQHLLEELQLKQELLYKIKEQFEVDMQSMRDDMKVLEANSGRHLDQEVTVLGKKMDDQKRDFNKSRSGLSGRMKALETQIAKLSKELLSIHSQPPALPCPDITAQKQLTPELQQAMEKWLTDHIQAQNAVILQQKGISSACTQPLANKMADFALETQGASVISTRCSETYHTRSACLSLLGFPLWYLTESPRTVIRGEPVLLPGKCWAFHGAHGTLVIALSHPIRITHVTLDHVPRHITPQGRIDSAPKDFAVYGMKNEVEEGTLLGTFTYNEDGEPTQTFELPPSDVIYHVVELRVLSNWGHMEYTCLYRFRVHGTLATAT